MTKSGWVKFADHAKGYGYILSEDAESPHDTLLFEIDDSENDFDSLASGTNVKFEVDGNGSGVRARNVVKVK